MKNWETGKCSAILSPRAAITFLIINSWTLIKGRILPRKIAFNAEKAELRGVESRHCFVKIQQLSQPSGYVRNLSIRCSAISMRDINQELATLCGGEIESAELVKRLGGSIFPGLTGARVESFHSSLINNANHEGAPHLGAVECSRARKSSSRGSAIKLKIKFR
jgi:hypothetical protein